MRDRNLNDDQLKLVKYRVLFVKRGYEAVLDDNSDMVHDNLSPEGFVAWKIAEFSRRLENVRVPTAWLGTACDRPRYPSCAIQRTIDGTPVWCINQFEDDDQKYLRVSFEVLNRTARERFEYEEDQVDVLRQIRDALASGSDCAEPLRGDSGRHHHHGRHDDDDCGHRDSTAAPSGAPGAPPASGSGSAASGTESGGWIVY